MTLRALLVLLVAALSLPSCNSRNPVPTSTLIINATVYDGTGSRGIEAAVRFDGDRIVEVGDIAPLDGETVIDAAGLALAPGFIDSHSHHDSALEDFRHMPGALNQGITTIVRGADGFSGDEDAFAYTSQAAFNAAFAANPAAVNVASFSPHNSIRYAVMGDDSSRVATPTEIAAMADLLTADLEAGALGLATGLEYEPGIYADTGEIIALARIAASFGGRYASHIRDEDDRFIDALNEVLQIGAAASIPVHVSHIKLADREFWGTTDAVVAILDAARDDGIQVTADIYPYERWASDLGVLFPDKDFANRETAEFTFAHTAAPEDIVVSFYAPNPAYEGLSIADIASQNEADPVTTLLTLSKQADDYLRETGRTGSGIIAKGMDERDVAALMRWEYTNICSDGGNDGGHPRGYGAFPRVLGHFVRDLGVLRLPEAIHKMTGLTANTLGIENRGRIAPGYYADLTLFDPATVGDRATMADPTAISVGIEKVWVNGVLAWIDGQPTHRYAGRVVPRAE